MIDLMITYTAAYGDMMIMMMIVGAGRASDPEMEDWLCFTK